MENNKQNSQEVDLSYLFKIFKANLLLILIVAIVCGAGLGVYRHVTTVPTYTSSVSFFVNGLSMSTDGTQHVNPGNSTAALTLAESFQISIKSRDVVSKAVAVLPADEKYEDISEVAARAMMSASLDVQILTLRVTHPDPDVAYEVAKAMEKVAPKALDSQVGLVSSMDDENSGVSVVKVIENAEKDVTPSSKNTVTFALIGFILGAVAVYVIAFLRAFFDRTVYTEEELKANFDLPVIGQIPVWNSDGQAASAKKLKRSDAINHRDYDGRILTAKTPFAVSEAFKLLRTNICYTANNGGCAVYGITSAHAGEGKSIVAANTAISFAQMGKKVLLIDADLRAAVQHKIFGLDAKASGLSDYLAGIAESEDDVIRYVDDNNMFVIQSGRIPPNPAELLASDRMKQLIEFAKENYDVVLIDLPPVCEVADAGVVSGLVNHYIAVVRSNMSDVNMIASAIDLLEGFGGSIAGFVINDLNLKSGGYYKSKYGKTYRYGYGAYGARRQ